MREGHTTSVPDAAAQQKMLGLPIQTRRLCVRCSAILPLATALFRPTTILQSGSTFQTNTNRKVCCIAWRKPPLGV